MNLLYLFQKNMNKTIDKKILIKFKNIIFKFANTSKYDFFLFWSRVDWTAKEKSNYDIWVTWKEKLDSITKLNIDDAFDNIPVLIDFIDFTQVEKKFKTIAMKNIIWLSKNK